MRVLVCGGRNYWNKGRVRWVLDSLCHASPFEAVITGGANGADMLGMHWADERGIESVVVPADWDKHGKAAGPIRNQAMLAERPDVVVAFNGNRGTADMRDRAKHVGIPVLEGDDTTLTLSDIERFAIAFNTRVRRAAVSAHGRPND